MGEELLRAETVDVVLLYPAGNGRAPAFWSSIGYGPREVSYLPPEELVPFMDGGPLLPEFDTGTHVVLPRWEKHIASAGPPSTSAVIGGLPLPALAPGAVQPRAKKKPRGAKLGTRMSSNAAWRLVPAADSRLTGEPLRRATEALIGRRARWKLAKPRCQQSLSGAAPRGAAQ
eukprot:NODE_4935_length_628_cov_4.675393.p2 GENE.NODE_4935_length_628_cov_4.675393~~NODE_4935_length_628_cov_4.675393.p2  ORF type:complete len:173 (+),score=30.78 NODE_4935_length_628_cov_4.675393:3-521(+)